jgi:signal transduction histidine kinase
VLLDVDAAALHLLDPDGGPLRRLEGTGALVPPSAAVDARAAFEAAVRRGAPFLGASVRGGATLHVPLAADGHVHALLSVARADGRGFGPVELDRARALGALLVTAPAGWGPPTAAPAGEDRTPAVEGLGRSQAESGPGAEPPAGDVADPAVARLWAVPEGRPGGDVEETLLVLAHQLRSPLAAVLGAAQALGPHAAGGQRRLVEIVARNAERALRLIGDALPADGPRDGVRRDVPLDLGTLARRAAEDAAHAGRMAGLRLDVSVPPGGGPTVRGDASLLAQVLDNLLGNAAAYTPAGGAVTVSVAVDPSAGGVRLEVRDTGPGIPAADRERVFDRFHRGPDAVARGVPGFGLGLTVVRAVVGAHGGTVTVDDAPGGGTRVRVLLPTAVGVADPVADAV